MDEEKLFLEIKALHDWLEKQESTSNVSLPKALSWTNLKDITGSLLPISPGFYIVKIVNGVDSQVVYIGESDNLSRRLSFLRGAIRRGNAPHSGGKTLRSKFGQDLSQFEICWLKTTNVYVAKLFERFLLLSFFEEHKRLPMGNKD